MIKVMLKPVIAFIGFGEHAIRGHYKHLREHPGCTVKGIFDPKLSDEALPLIMQDALHQYESVEELVNDEKVNAVFICSPDTFHLEQMQLCIRAGKHVFCEKPMFVHETDKAEFASLLLLAQSSQLVLTTCHPRRFDPPIVWLQDNMQRIVKKIGDLNTFEFAFSYHEVTDEWKKNRSLLSDHFSHEIDLFAHLCGDLGFTAERLTDGYDAYKVIGRDPNGLGFVFDGKRDQTESVYHEYVLLHGPQGTMKLFLNTGEVTYSHTTDTEQAPAKDYDVMFKRVNDNFIDSVQDPSKTYLQLNDMLRNNISAAELKDAGITSWRPRNEVVYIQ